MKLLLILLVIPLLWTWLGYPSMVRALAKGLPQRWLFELRPAVGGIGTPFVTAIIPVHNGASLLDQKLSNTLSLNYDLSRLSIIVACDGCTDDTVHIAQRWSEAYSCITVVSSEDRIGKTGIQNWAMSLTGSELILFTDVDTSLENNVLQIMGRVFSDPKVGCASGCVVPCHRGVLQSPVAQSEGLYWKLEHALWIAESRLGILLWASGQCMVARRSALAPIEAHYGEDVIVPLDVVARGWSNVCVPTAIAEEMLVDDSHVAVARRVRMTTRSFPATLSRFNAYLPWKHPLRCCAIMSHKILRWLGSLFFGSSLLLAAALVATSSDPIPEIVLGAEGCMLAAGVLGWICARLQLGIPYLSEVYSFMIVNGAMFVGVLRAGRNVRIEAYETRSGWNTQR